MSKYFIFSDVHNCFDEMINLFKKAEIKIENGLIISSPYIRIINLGDYCDKGDKPFETLEFLYNNQDWITTCIGNHEHFVVQYWRDKIPTTDQNILRFFDSTKIIDPEFRRKLCELYDNSVPFLIGPDFICSHAPCHYKFLTKTDNSSLRNQRNYRYTHLSKEQVIEEVSGFYNHGMFVKQHYFGHIACTKPIIGRNYIGIDTGAVFGNKLTGLVIGDGKPQIVQVDSKNYASEEEKLLDFKIPEKPISMKDLDSKERRMVNMYVENNVNFISGTVSPADKY